LSDWFANGDGVQMNQPDSGNQPRVPCQQFTTPEKMRPIFSGFFPLLVEGVHADAMPEAPEDDLALDREHEEHERWDEAVVPVPECRIIFPERIDPGKEQEHCHESEREERDEAGACRFLSIYYRDINKIYPKYSSLSMKYGDHGPGLRICRSIPACSSVSCIIHRSGSS